MAAKEIKFKELPFKPDYNQVFYIENDYDTDVNNFIRSNYFELKSMFSEIGLDFYYLPYLLREHDIEAKVRYYAPYLSPNLLVTKVRSNAFVPFISAPEASKPLKPSFIFEGTQEKYTGEVRFMQVVLSDIDFTKPDILDDLMRLMLETREAYCQKMIRNEIHAYKMSRRRESLDLEENAASNVPQFCLSPSASEVSLEELKSVRRLPKASNSKKKVVGKNLGSIKC